jgi:hypothetical protein
MPPKKGGDKGGAKGKDAGAAAGDAKGKEKKGGGTSVKVISRSVS